VYLNRYPRIVSSFKRSRRGRAILPSWSPRDAVLYLKEDMIDLVQSALSEALEQKALVLKIDEAIKMGLFGINKPGRRFLDRAGDLLILPRKKNLIWYEHTKGKLFDLLGVHGGLTKSEVLIPFAVSKLSDLASVQSPL
jgi:hypothetical protein